MDRAELIQQKDEVRARLERLRRQQAGLAAGDRVARQRAAALDAQIQALLAEEHRLRLLIDRSR